MEDRISPAELYQLIAFLSAPVIGAGLLMQFAVLWKKRVFAVAPTRGVVAMVLTALLALLAVYPLSLFVPNLVANALALSGFELLLFRPALIATVALVPVVTFVTMRGMRRPMVAPHSSTP